MKSTASFIAAGLVLISFCVRASEMEPLEWKAATISLVVPGKIPKKVEVTAEQNQQFDYSKFEIKIDGEKYSLDAEQLKQLKNYPLSSIGLGHESGPEQLGGHTVTVILQRENINENTKKTDVIYISVNKLGLALCELK